MKYDNLTHEERELVLFIQNNEQALFTVNHTNQKGMQAVIKQCAINFTAENSSDVDSWHDIFSGENINNVASHFNSKQIVQ